MTAKSYHLLCLSPSNATAFLSYQIEEFPSNIPSHLNHSLKKIKVVKEFQVFAYVAKHIFLNSGEIVALEDCLTCLVFGGI